MAPTQVTKIVRGLAGKEATIFNDKLKNGTRSVKVWGWKRDDYIQAFKVLKRAGMKVKLKRCYSFNRNLMAEYMQMRLHVKG